MRQRLTTISKDISNITQLNSSINLTQKKQPSIKQRLLAKWEETPAWARSDHILDGYRQVTNSYIGCFKSLFYVHNETGNVYSHVIGSFIFATLAFTTFYLLSHHATESKWLINWQDYAVVYTYIFCAIACLTLSSFFHLFLCHSEPVKKHWNKCDLVGIVLLIVASFYPTINYVFFCEPFWKLIYLGSITTLGFFTIVQCFSNYFYTDKFRNLRTLSFIGLALTGFVPLIHFFIKVGIISAIDYIPVKYIGMMGVFYLMGALVYLYRLPEKIFPGKFDYWFHSHQIFHIFVVIAALLHFNGILNSFKIHHSNFVGCF